MYSLWFVANLKTNSCLVKKEILLQRDVSVGWNNVAVLICAFKFSLVMGFYLF